MTPLSSIPAATQAVRWLLIDPAKFECLPLLLLTHVYPITYQLLAVMAQWDHLLSAGTVIVFYKEKENTGRQWYTSRENVST